jgi:tetratricopeptide (TPR) repeat protein/transcriptional regulator with XRE-family HTH domain
MATARQPSFGELLRRYRRTAGLTQEGLAAQAGMSAHGVADLEAGRRRSPRRDTVGLLAEALGLGERERAAFEAAARKYPATISSVGPRVGQPSVGAILAGARLVGRETEIAHIEAHLAGGGPPLLVLAGEPGIGKTRLLREAAAHARAQGWEVLEGGCHRRSGQEPFAPLLTSLERHLARQVAQQQRNTLRGCGWLVRLLPELAEAGVLSAPSESLPPEHERRLMFAAVERYVHNIAGPAGTLLVLDDLQWAATDALDLLAALLRAPSAVPLRVVAAYRDTEVRKRDSLAVHIADLVREELAARVALGPLSLLDAATLLDDLLADGAPTTPAKQAELKQQLIVRTGGVPYFLMSCAQAITSGVLAEHNAAFGVPSSVAETIRQRVGALTTEAQALLDVAAVVGREVPRTLLLRVLEHADRPEETLLAALDAACAARLLIEEGDHAYEFAHDLVREVLVTDLTAARRVRLHRKVAEVLEQEPGEAPVETLAYHYAQSDMPEKAADYLERAGDRARARCAQAEAIGHYRQVVERLDTLGRATDAALARAKLGSVLVVTAQFDEALNTLQAAVAVHRSTGDEDRLLATAALIGWIHSLRGTPGEGITYLKTFSERSAPDQVPPRGAATIYAALAHLYYLGGQYREQLIAAEQAVALARLTQDRHVLAQAAFEHGTALLYHGRFSEALVVLEDTIPLAEETGDLWTLCWLLSSASTIYHFRGQWDPDQRCIDRALGLAERLGDPPMITLMTFRSGTIAHMRGAWEEARQHLTRCMQIQEKTQPSWITPYPMFLRGEIELAMGNDEAAMPLLHESIALSQRSGDLSPQRFAQAALAEHDLLAGRPDAARARLEPLLDRPGQQEGQVMSLLPLVAWAHLDVGDEAQAEALVAQATERSGAMGGYFAQVDVLRVRAMLLMRQHQWAEAKATLDESLRLARTMPYPYAEAKTLYVSGLLHIRKGDKEQASGSFKAALGILHRLGERLYASHIERAM